MSFSQSDKIFGLLFGCAYGDAMGMPSEMMCRTILDETFPDGIHALLPSSKNDFFKRKFKAGEVTDDTVNTLLVCDSIIEDGKFDTELYLRKLLRWADENPEKNASQIGPSTSKALDLLRAGKSYVESGKYGTTNGSAMKVSPLGILHDYHDIQGLVDDVCKLCLPTHNTSVAIAGASVIATLSSYALRHEYDEEEIWSLAKLAIEEGMKHGNQLPSASLSKRLDLIRQDIKTLSEKEVLEKLETVYGVGFETIETIPAVLAMIILSKGNPMKSAQLSANIAGDSDTIGSISTAICGAFHTEFNSLDIKHIEEVNGINFKKYVDGLERVFK